MIADQGLQRRAADVAGHDRKRFPRVANPSRIGPSRPNSLTFSLATRTKTGSNSARLAEMSANSRASKSEAGTGLQSLESRPGAGERRSRRGRQFATAISDRLFCCEQRGDASGSGNGRSEDSPTLVRFADANVARAPSPAREGHRREPAAEAPAATRRDALAEDRGEDASEPRAAVAEIAVGSEQRFLHDTRPKLRENLALRHLPGDGQPVSARETDAARVAS